MPLDLSNKEYYCFRSGAAVRVSQNEVLCLNIYDGVYCALSSRVLLDCVVIKEAEKSLAQSQLSCTKFPPTQLLSEELMQ